METTLSVGDLGVGIKGQHSECLNCHSDVILVYTGKISWGYGEYIMGDKKNISSNLSKLNIYFLLFESCGSYFHDIYKTNYFFNTTNLEDNLFIHGIT